MRFAGALTGDINIGGSLASTASITLPAGGLQSQVVANSTANLTSLWVGPVTVGSVTLSPIPFYTQKSSTLGGGAVGQVPYGLHQADCTPARDLTNPALPVDGISVIRPIKGGNASGTTPQVIVTSYGRIAAGTTALSPVRIDHLQGSTWVDSTSFFVVTMPASNSTGIASRSINIQTAPTATPLGGRYRVVPVNVVCLDTTATPPPAVGWLATATTESPQAYFFKVACRGDFDQNGVREVQDIFAFLAAWFARSPLTDYNGSGGIASDVNDIFAFLNSWFSKEGCDTTALTATQLATSANQIYAIDPETGELYESLSLAPLPVLIDSVQSFLLGQPDDARKAAVQAALNDENVTPVMIFTALCASYGTTCELVPTGA